MTKGRENGFRIFPDGSMAPKNYEGDILYAKKNDWRLTCQENYLKNAKLFLKSYLTDSSHWDHDHCAFCWDKFSESEGDLHEGYSTADNKHWICKDCFNDFKQMFNFEVISEN